MLWRGGAVGRGLTVGLCVGLFLGGLAWLDSGMLLAGVAVFVVLGVGSSVWTTRKSDRYWPGARELTGAQRASVVAAVHRGELIGDPALIGAVRDYARAVHRAAQDHRPVRWLLVFLLAVAVVSAAFDAFAASLGNAVVSAIYLVLIGLELFWWPKRQDRLLENADRSEDQASGLDVAE